MSQKSLGKNLQNQSFFNFWVPSHTVAQWSKVSKWIKIAQWSIGAYILKVEKLAESTFHSKKNGKQFRERCE